MPVVADVAVVRRGADEGGSTGPSRDPASLASWCLIRCIPRWVVLRTQTLSA